MWQLFRRSVTTIAFAWLSLIAESAYSAPPPPYLIVEKVDDTTCRPLGTASLIWTGPSSGLFLTAAHVVRSNPSQLYVVSNSGRLHKPAKYVTSSGLELSDGLGRDLALLLVNTPELANYEPRQIWGKLPGALGAYASNPSQALIGFGFSGLLMGGQLDCAPGKIKGFNPESRSGFVYQENHRWTKRSLIANTQVMRGHSGGPILSGETIVGVMRAFLVCASSELDIEQRKDCRETVVVEAREPDVAVGSIASLGILATMADSLSGVDSRVETYVDWVKRGDEIEVREFKNNGLHENNLFWARLFEAFDSELEYGDVRALALNLVKYEESIRESMPESALSLHIRFANTVRNSQEIAGVYQKISNASGAKLIENARSVLKDAEVALAAKRFVEAVAKAEEASLLFSQADPYILGLRSEGMVGKGSDKERKIREVYLSNAYYDLGYAALINLAARRDQPDQLIDSAATGMLFALQFGKTWASSRQIIRYWLGAAKVFELAGDSVNAARAYSLAMLDRDGNRIESDKVSAPYQSCMLVSARLSTTLDEPLCLLGDNPGAIKIMESAATAALEIRSSRQKTRIATIR